MKSQVPQKIYKLFEDLILEYAEEKVLFNKEPLDYHKKSDFIIGGILNLSSKEERDKIDEREKNGIPVVKQLLKNKKTVKLTDEISKILMKNNQINYVNSEMTEVVDRISFEYFNELVSKNDTQNKCEQKKTLKLIIDKHISSAKEKSFSYRFKFPVHIIGLNNEIRLNSRLHLEYIDKTLIDDNSMEKFLSSREFKPNFNLCISSKTKSSYKYAERRATRTKNATLNLLLLLYGRSCSGSWLSPIVKVENKKQHFFNYFHSSKNGEEYIESRSYKFNYNKSQYEDFWNVLKKDIEEHEIFFKILFSIPSKIMSNANFNKSVCSLIERSIKWFSDAIDEDDFEIKVVKLTMAIESLINFKRDSKGSDLESDRFKKTFVDRVCIINHLDDNANKRATELYNARSAIAHGSPLKSKFNFDITHFTADTILLSIQFFYLFGKNSDGLDKINFSNALPEFIDNFPKWTPDEKSSTDI